AGLWGVGVDNAIIELDGPEPPACDGSAREFASRALEVGLVDQDGKRRVLKLNDSIAVGTGATSISASPSSSFEVEYLLDYGNAALPLQHATLQWTPESFASDIA